MSVHREMNNRMRYMEEIHFHSTHALHIPVKMKRNDYYPQNASKVKCIKISPLLQLWREPLSIGLWIYSILFSYLSRRQMVAVPSW